MSAPEESPATIASALRPLAERATNTQPEDTMTTAMEWRTTDKSAWGKGPWQTEPDKAQWVDEATDLDCLAVRGPHGGWCGYVGVPETHPWHGIGYSQCVQGCEESWCGHSPESSTEVHGGLTFASSCHEATREQFERMRAQLPEHERTAARYPRGDSAEWVAQWRGPLDDYDAWRAAWEGRAICHVPLPGRSAHVWWFGFDCAHSGDLSPKYANDERLSFRRGGDVYRTLDYVREQCASLARQLAAATPAPEPTDAR